MCLHVYKMSRCFLTLHSDVMFEHEILCNLSTEFFLIFLLFSVVIKSIVYWISLVICKKVEFKFLIKQFLAKNVCFQCSMNFMGVSK